MNTESELHIISGPCAAESREQVLFTAQEALSRNIQTVRLSLWKPRTKPGFEGIGEAGIPLLFEVAQMGLRPATEVLFPKHAEAVLNGVIGKNGHTEVLIWLGSRNQNHPIQHDIGTVVAGEPRVKLMIKNQMWKDRGHWEGIVDHVLSGGASPNQLLLCHRGFAPAADGLRNPPDINMALQVKRDLSRKLGVPIPMIADPSHIAGGSPDNVMRMALQLAAHTLPIEEDIVRIDGLLIEVHPNPTVAATDRDQQLRWDQLDVLLSQLKRREPAHSILHPTWEVG